MIYLLVYLALGVASLLYLDREQVKSALGDALDLLAGLILWPWLHIARQIRFARVREYNRKAEIERQNWPYYRLANRNRYFPMAPDQLAYAAEHWWAGEDLKKAS